MLGETGNVSIRSLSEKMNVSEMTLRRDLGELESRGLVRRVHGGAVLASDRDPGYWLRYKQFQKEKRIIGTATASLIQADQTVYLDTGTTAIEVARALVRRSLEENLRVRVVTHAINVGAELAGNPKISLHQIGGEIFPDTLGATGRESVQQILALNYDLFFLGVSGAEQSAGWTNSSPVGIDTKQAVIERAKKTFVIADSSKWGKVSFLPVAPINGVDGWITDSGMPAGEQNKLHRLGVPVIVANEMGRVTSKASITLFQKS